MPKRLHILTTLVFAACSGWAYGQDLAVDISLETTAAPDGRLRYEYVIENLPENELTINAFLLDVEDGADILDLEYPQGWYGEYVAEEDPFELAWIAQGPQFEIPVGGSGTFSFTSPLEPAPILTYIANLTPVGDEVGAFFGSFDGPALPPTSGRIPGDYNGSGLVEQGDLDLVLGFWGADSNDVPATWTNELPEGFVDQAELDNVLGNWGSMAPEFAATGAVPEPATSLLLIACVTFAIARRAAVRPTGSQP